MTRYPGDPGRHRAAGCRAAGCRAGDIGPPDVGPPGTSGRAQKNPPGGSPGGFSVFAARRLVVDRFELRRLTLLASLSDLG